MQRKGIRVGIVGCGFIAPVHIEALWRLPGVQVVALADADEHRARTLAERYGIPGFTADYHRLLESDLEIADICTPSGLHHRMVLDALEAGKHVIVEKPLAIDLDQADAMIATAARQGLVLAVIFNRRFNPLVLKVRKALDEGRFGNLVLLDAQIKWHRTEAYYRNSWRGTWAMDGGGVLANQAVHWIDLLQWFGGPVGRVYGRARTATHPIEAADLAVAMLEFQGGALGMIEASTSIYPGNQGKSQFYDSLPERVGIYGQSGSAEITGAGELSLWEFRDCVEETQEAADNPAGGDPAEEHRAQMAQIVDAVRDGKRVQLDGTEARKSIEIVRAVYFSSFTGRPVDFPFTLEQDRELDRLIERHLRSRR